MVEPLIHFATQEAIVSSLKGSHHAFALSGPYGSGKAYLASWLSQNLLGNNPRPQHVQTISPVDGIIGIDQIRQVITFLKLRTTGSAEIRRVVFIEDAHTMTVEAQNSLLKALEEPPEDTRFVLTIAGRRALLPTVLSRLQVIDVMPVTEKAFTEYLKDQANSPDIKRAYAISGGLAGLGLALLNDRDHELTAAIEEAKAILTKSVYERLLLVDELSKDKERTQLILFALKRILSVSLAQASGNKLNRMVLALKPLLKAEASFSRNPNAKLALANVMLSL